MRDLDPTEAQRRLAAALADLPITDEERERLHGRGMVLIANLAVDAFAAQHLPPAKLVETTE